MEHQLYYVLGWGAPIISALVALFLIKQINGREAGSENMQRIAALIRSGAMAFLNTEYSVLAGFVVVMFFVLAFFIGQLTAVAFLVGAGLSATAGWIGMRTATGAAVRTTHAATDSLSSALNVAFSSGAVMGLTVVALGTLGTQEHVHPRKSALGAGKRAGLLGDSALELVRHEDALRASQQQQHPLNPRTQRARSLQGCSRDERVYGKANGHVWCTRVICARGITRKRSRELSARPSFR